MLARVKSTGEYVDVYELPESTTGLYMHSSTSNYQEYGTQHIYAGSELVFEGFNPNTIIPRSINDYAEEMLKIILSSPNVNPMTEDPSRIVERSYEYANLLISKISDNDNKMGNKC